MEDSSRGRWPTISLAIAALILVGGGFYLYLHSGRDSESNINTTGWKTYTNAAHGFSFQYPAVWYLQESSDTTLVSFSKSELSGPNATTTGKIFAAFYANELVTPDKKKVSPQDYISYYDQAPESGEWELLNGIPVWSYRIIGEEEYRYETFTSQKVYGFVLYANTAERATTLTSHDFESIEKILSTLSLSNPSETFVDPMSDAAASLSILIPNGGVLKAGSMTTITWLPGNAPTTHNTVSLQLMTPDMRDEILCPESGLSSLYRAHDCRLYSLFNDIPNTGSVQWEVGKTAGGLTVPPGNYYMKIYFGGVENGKDHALEVKSPSARYSEVFTIAAS